MLSRYYFEHYVPSGKSYGSYSTGFSSETRCCLARGPWILPSAIALALIACILLYIHHVYNWSKLNHEFLFMHYSAIDLDDWLHIHLALTVWKKFVTFRNFSSNAIPYHLISYHFNAIPLLTVRVKSGMKFKLSHNKLCTSVKDSTSR